MFNWYAWIMLWEEYEPFFLGLVGVIVASLVVPKLRFWLRIRRRRRNRLYERFTAEQKRLESDEKESRNAASLVICKILARDLVPSFLVLALVACGAVHLDRYTDNKTLELIKENIYLMDEIHDSNLLGRSTRMAGHDSDDQLRSEYLCGMKASAESKKMNTKDFERIGVAGQTYRICMLEQGWLVEECKRGEEDCVEIGFTESACTMQRREAIAGDKESMAYVVFNC